MHLYVSFISSGFDVSLGTDQPQRKTALLFGTVSGQEGIFSSKFFSSNFKGLFLVGKFVLWVDTMREVVKQKKITRIKEGCYY